MLIDSFILRLKMRNIENKKIMFVHISDKE